MAHHDKEQLVGVDELIKEQQRLASSKNPFERVVGALCLAGALKKKLSLLSDKSLAQLMFDHVWNELTLLSPEMTICSEATERMLGSPIKEEDNDSRMHR